MAHTEQRMRSKRERIERLRARIKKEQGATHLAPSSPLWAIMLGILDLLEDEL